MHQILSLRAFFNKKKQQWDKTDTRHFKHKWGFETFSDFLKDPQAHIDKIPRDERFDFYYTVANCAEGKREFRDQEILVFDVDGIGEDLINARTPKELGELYLTPISKALKVLPSSFSVVFSGGGLHFILNLQTKIIDPTYFNSNRLRYNAICAQIDAELQKVGLPGAADRAVFDPRRIMRLPGTENRKEGRPVRMAVLTQISFELTDFDVARDSGLPELEAKDQISEQAFKKYPPADTEAVLQGCSFMRFCKEQPQDVKENQWYAMLSIAGRMPEGRKLAHELSQKHPKYTPGETDAKLDQAMSASGPRTCENISGLFEGCQSCPHFKTHLASPIMIQGESFIATKETGFHHEIMTERGPKYIPDYAGLLKHFENTHAFVSLEGICYTFTGTHWVEQRPAYVKSFAEKNFNPEPNIAKRQEFAEKLKLYNLISPDFFTETTMRKINFQNGVLDVETMELLPHSTIYGFRYVLNYSYDPQAKSPVFDKFLLEVMDARPELGETLLEFAGYSLSGDRCWATKSLFLSGHGRNGKSTMIKVLQAIAGVGNFSSIGLRELSKNTSRKLLDGKLFNLCEETPTTGFFESEMLKSLVGGGMMTVKTLYQQEYEILNKTKFIYSCNELPQSKDTSYGFFRRLLIVPFERHFMGIDDDPFIEEKMLKELPGIFNQMIAGYKKMRARLGFIDHDVLKAAREEYQEDVDSISHWLATCVEVKTLDPQNLGSPLSSRTLYAHYSGFTDSEGDRAEKQTTFAKRLAMLLKSKYNDGKLRRTKVKEEGEYRNAFYGLKINSKEEF